MNKEQKKILFSEALRLFEPFILNEGGYNQNRLYFEEDTLDERTELEDKAPPVELQVNAGAEEDMSIPLPTVKITEAWGQPDSEDRRILELLMQNVKGDTVKQKLNSVGEFLEYQPGRKINEIFSNLLFTEIFSNIMDEYNASTAGFLFEAFLAGLFGGSRSLQIADKDEETGNLPIVDVELNGVPYSLKVLSPDTSVKGSFFNLVNHFDKSDYVKYLVVEKQGEGVLAFYEFELNLSTFLNYIGYSGGMKTNKQKDFVKVGELTTAGGKVYYAPEGNDEVLYPVTSGVKAAKEAIEGMDDDELVRIEYLAEPIRDVRSNTEKLYGDIQAYDDLVATKEEELIAKLKQQPGYKGKKQFEIRPAYVRQTAELIGELSLGRDELKAVAKEYAKDLQDSLIPIYRALQELTTNTNKYFLSEEGETTRKEHALLASGNAGTLKNETEKLVK